MAINTDNEVKKKLISLYNELFVHNGYGEMSVTIKLLRRGQKEIIIHCGKEYRFVVDCKQPG